MGEKIILGSAAATILGLLVLLGYTTSKTYEDVESNLAKGAVYCSRGNSEWNIAQCRNEDVNKDGNYESIGLYPTTDPIKRESGKRLEERVIRIVNGQIVTTPLDEYLRK